MRVGINGLGRIGRTIVRCIFEEGYDVSFIQLNTSSKMDDLVHLLKYDSVYGRFKQDIKIINNSTIRIGEIDLVITNSSRETQNYSWDNIDFVMECTGSLKTAKQLQKHIEQGSRKVILSCPAKDEIQTFVIGVNQDKLGSNDIVSIGSCTTNCLGPIAKVINDKFGIEKGFVSTIHAYTNDQNILDSNHKDKRRSRAAAMSIIPTSTGAAKTIGIIMPELAGKLDGAAIRVPTPSVSVVDCTFLLSNRTTEEEVIKEIISKSTNDFYSKALSYTLESLVSVDFVHNKFSSIVDIQELKMVDKNLLRILSWYDNEYAFSARMLDTATLMHKMQNKNTI